MSTRGRRTEAGRIGGLQGKARRNRNKNRAWRLHSQQLIEEFVEPKPRRATTPRHIPIRRRAEFIPSAPVLGSEFGVGTEQELELVYSTRSEEDPNEGGMFDEAYAIVPPAPADDAAICFSNSPSGGPPTEVKAAERDALLDGFRLHARRSLRNGHRFTLQGFALGCALGTAAAAVVLMMFRAAFL